MVSSMFSIRPEPKVGVGIRKMTLPVFCACAKLGCPCVEPPTLGKVQPAASVRPLMV